MARRVDKPDREWASRGLYPWDEWLDGSVWELEEPEDFNCARVSLLNAAVSAATTRSGKVRSRNVHRHDRPFFIQFYREDGAA